MLKKKITVLLGIIGLALVTTAGSCDNSEMQQRTQQQAAKKDAAKNSLEIANLKERFKRQERATAIGYVYLLNFGKPFGYYVIKGKVSSSGSQLTPEQDIIDACGTDICPVVADGPQDDGTYGQGDPGIFFFTAEGTLVETSIDYIYSDQPLSIDVPLLSK